MTGQPLLQHINGEYNSDILQLTYNNKESVKKYIFLINILIYFNFFVLVGPVRHSGVPIPYRPVDANVATSWGSNNNVW